MNILSKIISPKLGFGLLKKKIEQTLNKKINSYQLLINAFNDEEPVKFIVDGETKYYPPEDGFKLKNAIELALKNQIPENSATFERILINYIDKDNIEAKVGWKNEKNEKSFMTIKL